MWKEITILQTYKCDTLIWNDHLWVSPIITLDAEKDLWLSWDIRKELYAEIITQ